MTSTELMKEDEEIYKRLKIPWTPEGMQIILGDKCIDSEKENLQRSIKKYKNQIECLHEDHEGLVIANKILIEYLECAKIIENYALFFLFWVIEIECRPRADGDEF